VHLEAPCGQHVSKLLGDLGRSRPDVPDDAEDELVARLVSKYSLRPPLETGEAFCRK
jgi:hypothetical protein